MAAARRCRAGWLAVLLAAACGCGSGGEATVSGKVTYQDRPVTYGSVIFVGPDQKTRSAAIRPDGGYTVQGLTPGESAVSVISRDPAKGRAPKGAAGTAGGPGGWFPIPRRYEAASESGLACTLKAGPNNYDIALK
jgi:hypothetical protein